MEISSTSKVTSGRVTSKTIRYIWYNLPMQFEHQHDWALFDERSRQGNTEWLRSLTPAQCVELYQEMFRIAWQARQQSTGDWQQLESRRWKAKLALREKMVSAFQQMDKLRIERSNRDNIG